MQYPFRRKRLFLFWILVCSCLLPCIGQTADQLIRQAAAQLHSLRVSEAEILLLQAREKDPANPQAAVLLGHLYLLRGSINKALDCFSSALKLQPENETARLGRSLTLGQLGRPDEATEELEILLSRGRPSLEVRQLWVFSLFMQGKDDQALLEAQNLAIRFPQRPDIQRLLGFLSKTRGDYLKAYRYLKKAADLDPNHFKTLIDLSVLAGIRGDWGESGAWVERAIRVDLGQPLGYERMAKVLDHLGKSQEAETMRQKAAQYRKAEILYGQSQQAGRNRQDENQEKLLRECLDANPGHFTAWMDLAENLERDGRHAAAQQAYRRVLQLQPAYLQARLRLAAQLLSQHQTKQALEQYEQALRFTPQAPEIYTALASAYLQQRAFQKAAEAAVKAACLQPDDPDLLAYSGYILQVSGMPQKAEPLYVQALQGSPTLVEAELGLAQVCRQQMNLRHAMDIYQRLANTHPEIEQVWIGLIDVLRHESRLAEAEVAARKCLNRIPGSMECREALASLRLHSAGFGEAIGLYQGLILAGKDSKSIQDGLGFAWLKLHNFSEAERCFLKSISFRTDDPWVFSQLGYCRKMQRDLAGSVGAYRRSAALSPEDAARCHEYGLALYLNGEYQAAVPALQKAIEMKPQWGEAYLNLALSLWHCKDYSGALEQARRAQALGAKGADSVARRLESYLHAKAQTPLAVHSLR